MTPQQRAEYEQRRKEWEDACPSPDGKNPAMRPEGCTDEELVAWCNWHNARPLIPGFRIRDSQPLGRVRPSTTTKPR